MSALVAENLSVGYKGDRQLFSNLSFSLNYGSALVLRGRNGSGKSTLLRVITGNRNTVLAGKITNSFESIGHVPQVFNANFHVPCTLKEVVLSASQQQETNTYPLLTSETLVTLWQNASGGERQKAVFLRILSQKPQLVLLDEPTNHLDRKSVTKFWRYLESYILSAPDKRAVIIVSHDENRKCFEDIPVETIDLDLYSSAED